MAVFKLCIYLFFIGAFFREGDGVGELPFAELEMGFKNFDPTHSILVGDPITGRWE